MKYMFSVCLLAFINTVLIAQPQPVFDKTNLSGPRLGVTVAPDGSLYDELKERGINPVLSQFGWHFEYTIQPKELNSPSFVIEFIPMVGGVESGTVIPHLTLAMGVRMPSGFEFGLGPNALFTEDTVHTALVVGIGKSFRYGDVNIPLNFSVATSPKGNRYSITFGYAIAERRRY